jgi:hypothetical protein
MMTQKTPFLKIESGVFSLAGYRLDISGLLICVLLASYVVSLVMLCV